MGSIQAKLRLFIAGNHDISLDESFYTSHHTDMYPIETHAEALALCTGSIAQAAGVTYLTEGTHTFTLDNGARLTIYASPYSTRHGDWAFQYPTTEDRYNETTPQRSLAVSTATEASVIPSFPEVDIVMTHGPPRYMLDTFSNNGNAGCEHLLRAVARAKPLLHCFGHVHTGWGAQAVLWGKKSKSNESGKQELTPEFFGKNEMKRKGYAMKDMTRFEHGEATWMVNGAVRDGDGEASQVPFVVTVNLPLAV